MRRTFIELPAFTRLVSAGDISEDQIAALQEEIIRGGGMVIVGTGGVKKIRCEGRGHGKSGGWRVLFADYDREEVTVLIWAYPKNKQANLTGAQRNVVRGLKARLDEEIKVKYGKQE